MNWLMLSCKKASGLIEKKLLVRLYFKENVQLHMHKSMCSACTAYEQQSKKIDELFHQHLNGDHKTISSLNDRLKQKIINTIGKN